ncbi:hypothetical protein AAE478_002007 [Parahypoxylon ruwenzoriense]
MASNKSFETRLFINNQAKRLVILTSQYVESTEKDRLTVTDPRTGKIVTSDVHIAGHHEVDAAVSSARTAFETGPWSKCKGVDRAKLLHKLADLLEQNSAAIAEAESVAMGNPASAVQLMDIGHAVDVFRYYAGWADKLSGDSYPADDGCLRIVEHEPIGVCAGITAWNASLMFFAWKAAPALATGNTMILKASEKSPLGFIALGRLVVEAGFPPGVVQFLSGAAETGKLLALHPHIRKISFTGSKEAGKHIQQAAAASNLKRVTLELGGKSAAIVFPDADIRNALFWCVTPSFKVVEGLKLTGEGVIRTSQTILANAGQICAATTRLYLHRSIADQFLPALKEIFQQAVNRLGAEAAGPMQIGPIVDKVQFDRIMAYIESGKKDASLLVGGMRKGDTGYYIEPTIFVNPQPDAAIYREEIFGPVLTVRLFDDEEQVTTWTNDTEYGLSGAVYTQDINRGIRVAKRFKSGSVGVNGVPMPSPVAPMGGVKGSGFGRELGKYALEEYTETKTIAINLAGTPAF